MNKSGFGDHTGNEKLNKKINDFRARCRQAHLKVTPQRMAIYKVLVQSNEHPSAEMVYRQVKQDLPHISLDTVNRTLVTINELGMSFTLEGTGDAKRYDGILDDHQHFKCLKCKKVIDLFDEPFSNIPTPAKLEKCAILRKTVYFEGICDSCKQKTNGNLI